MPTSSVPPARFLWIFLGLVAVGLLAGGGLIVRHKIAHYFEAPGPQLHRPESSEKSAANTQEIDPPAREIANARPEAHDRPLTNEQHARFLQITHGAPRGNALVSAVGNDREAFIYANKLAAMLHQAGFGKKGTAVALFTDFEPAKIHTAVVLYVSRERALPPFAAAIQDAFDVIGIQNEIAYREDAEHPNDLHIFIYPKP